MAIAGSIYCGRVAVLYEAWKGEEGGGEWGAATRAGGRAGEGWQGGGAKGIGKGATVIRGTERRGEGGGNKTHNSSRERNQTHSKGKRRELEQKRRRRRRGRGERGDEGTSVRLCHQVLRREHT